MKKSGTFLKVDISVGPKQFMKHLDDAIDSVTASDKTQPGDTTIHRDEEYKSNGENV